MEKIALKLAGLSDFFTQEAYKTLRTNLQFCGQDIKVICITSCHENEGKTTISLNLGKSLAELGRKVLVIDADMRKSVMVGRHTEIQNPHGLSEILTGQATFDEAAYCTEDEQMHIVFAGMYPPNPVELLGGKYFQALIERARKAYDYVLIDTPPLGRVIDAAVVAPVCDGTILVIADNSVRSKQALEVVEQLKVANSKILGVVRNSVKRKGAGYYRFRYSKYGKYYGKRYGYGSNTKKS